MPSRSEVSVLAALRKKGSQFFPSQTVCCEYFTLGCVQWITQLLHSSAPRVTQWGFLCCCHSRQDAKINLTNNTATLSASTVQSTRKPFVWKRVKKDWTKQFPQLLLTFASYQTTLSCLVIVLFFWVCCFVVVCFFNILKPNKIFWGNTQEYIQKAKITHFFKASSSWLAYFYRALNREEHSLSKACKHACISLLMHTGAGEVSI